MENTQKRPLYLLEDGVDESAVKLLPKLRSALQSLMDGRVVDRERKTPLLVLKNSGCWEWQGYRNKDHYGHISVKGRSVYAHRFFYEKVKAEIPRGLFIDHLCRNPPCVNPAHLEPVTLRENNRRGWMFRNPLFDENHCKAGHELKDGNFRITCDGSKTCRICKKAEDAERYRRGITTIQKRTRKTGYRFAEVMRLNRS